MKIGKHSGPLWSSFSPSSRLIAANVIERVLLSTSIVRDGLFFCHLSTNVAFAGTRDQPSGEICKSPGRPDRLRDPSFVSAESFLAGIHPMLFIFPVRRISIAKLRLDGLNYFDG